MTMFSWQRLYGVYPIMPQSEKNSDNIITYAIYISKPHKHMKGSCLLRKKAYQQGKP
jgi:hypothetical protein